MIHYWEVDKRRVSERHELLYAQVLQVRPDILAHGPDGTPLRSQAKSRRSQDDTASEADEKDFMCKLSYGAAIDDEVLEIFRSETKNLRLLDRKLGAPMTIGRTRAHIEHLDVSIRYTLNSGIHRNLAYLLGENLTLAGWQSVDLGQLRSAWDYYEDAKTAAREAEDHALLSHAAAEQAYVLAELGAFSEALELVQATCGEHHRSVPTRLRSWLRAVEAEIAAMNGDERTTRYALDAAAIALPGNSEEDQLAYLFLDELHLARWRGNCLSYFGDSTTSQELSDVLQGMDQSFTRAAAGVHHDLARAMLAQGELQECKNHLSRARHLARLTGSARQRRKVDRLAALVG
jgi:tetratricopeptide (TPR) repeat protein